MNATDLSPVDRHALRLAESLRSRSTFQVVLDCLIHGSISSTALIGNLFVLYVVYKSPRLRNVPGLFVVSLALSDIAMATLVTPQSFAALIAGRWISGFALCQLQGYVVITTVAASLQTMAVMSIDRYFRVVRPTKHRTLFTMQRARLMTASVWLLSLLYPNAAMTNTGSPDGLRLRKEQGREKSTKTPLLDAKQARGHSKWQNKHSTRGKDQTTTPGTLCPTLYDKRVGSFTSSADHNTEDAGDGAYGLSSLSEKTRISNHLQMLLQRQHTKCGFFLSTTILNPYLTIII
ncbi:hypothetical protein ACROYT_G009685 [Oculina patagonica]